MAEVNLFNILENRGSRGFFPLNENHWSNVLAWLLDRTQNELLARSLLKFLSPGCTFEMWKVEREIEYAVGSRRRFIDIHITSDQGVRLFVEVKTDPTYQDRNQIADQLSILGPNEHLVIVAPLDLSALLTAVKTSSGNPPKAQARTWHAVSKWCSGQGETRRSGGPMVTLLLAGIAQYWSSPVTTPFEQMVKTIIEERGWTTFFPDEFKEEFLRRFPDTWAYWLEGRPATGNGNPHQYLLTSLAMLANRRNGFRLVRTGNSRKPNPLDWGFPIIYEFGVVTPAQQSEE